MKQLTAYIIIFIIAFSANAGESDSIVYESNGLTITKNLRKNSFTIASKLKRKKLTNLKFARLYQWKYIQVLDKNNRMFLIDDQMNEQDSTLYNGVGFCGTVPHYVLTISETDSSFQVFEDETFYDNENIPPQMTLEVNKTIADSISFLYGEDNMLFTSNFGLNNANAVNPRTVILMKEGNYSTLEYPDRKYDAITYGNSQNYLVTTKNGLLGVLDVIEPKFAEVHKFKGFLAKVILPDGKVGYIDIDGNEY